MITSLSLFTCSVPDNCPSAGPASVAAEKVSSRLYLRATPFTALWLDEQSFETHHMNLSQWPITFRSNLIMDETKRVTSYPNTRHANSIERIREYIEWEEHDGRQCKLVSCSESKFCIFVFPRFLCLSKAAATPSTSFGPSRAFYACVCVCFVFGFPICEDLYFTVICCHSYVYGMRWLFCPLPHYLLIL